MAVKWIKLSTSYPENDEAPKEIVVKKRKRRTVSTKTSVGLEAGEHVTSPETEQLVHSEPVTSTADLVTPTADHVTSTGEHITSITKLPSDLSSTLFQVSQLGTALN